MKSLKLKSVTGCQKGDLKAEPGNADEASRLEPGRQL